NDTPGVLYWFEAETANRGSQWQQGNDAGDPTLRTSAGPSYTYGYGDALKLYNRIVSGGNATHLTQANRSILWLKPDVLVIYDRATSKTAGRFKRFNLQLPSIPGIVGQSSVATT